jgi:hypothetical protein
MKTYLLFLFSNFKDHDDVEFFCIDVLGVSPKISKVRFVIEDTSKSIIVIFESTVTRKELSEELQNIISMEDVKFYFLFERESIYSANLPVQMKDFMFKPSEEHVSLRLEYNQDKSKEKPSHSMDLDIILDKIEQFGMESLTPDEKKFLDDFKN